VHSIVHNYAIYEINRVFIGAAHAHIVASVTVDNMNHETIRVWDMRAPNALMYVPIDGQCCESGSMIGNYCAHFIDTVLRSLVIDDRVVSAASVRDNKFGRSP
jgi:hypothetical protein